MANDPIWDQIAGSWKQFTGKIREQWGDLTDDEIMQMEGKRDNLEGKIQERYGIERTEAQSQVSRWLQNVTTDANKR